MAMRSGPFGARATLKGQWGSVDYFRLDALTKQGIAEVDQLPFTIKVLLENMLRRCDGASVRDTLVTRSSPARHSRMMRPSRRATLQMLPCRRSRHKRRRRVLHLAHPGDDPEVGA